MQMKKTLAIAALLAALACGKADAAGLQITEWMYNGLGVGSIGEYVEFTNLGPSPITTTNWSFDDNGRVAGSQLLSAYGTIAVGESVILTDDTEANFRTNWGLPASVKVIGGNTNNLGRSDEVNLYDSFSALVDRLTYNDQGVAPVNGPRTSAISGNPVSLPVVGANTANQWIASVNGDAYGSHLSLLNEIGNPGTFSLFTVPEPSTIALAAIGLVFGALLAVRRRRRGC